MPSGSKHRSKQQKQRSAAAAHAAPRVSARQKRESVEEAREVRQRRERDMAAESETVAGYGGILEDGQNPEELERDDDDGEDAVDGDEDWYDEDESDDEDGPDDEDEDDFDVDNDEGDEDEGPEEYTADTYLAGHVIPLPSGKSIRVRPMSFITMIERDEAEIAAARRDGREAKTVIPNHLLAVARRMVFGDGSKQSQQASGYAARRAAYEASRRGGRAEKPRTKAEETRESAQLIDFLCTKLIASFPVSMKPQVRCPRGVVSIESIFESDKIAVVQYAMQGQTALAAFRR